LTRSNVLVRSDYLGHLTATGRDALIAYGVTTVIDLRSASEVVKKPNPFADGSGPAYVHRERIDDANMRQIGDSPDMFDRYLMILDNRPQAFRAIFESVAAVDGGVLFHCYAGKDRTGLVAAMLLDLAGVSPGDIAVDYGETDLCLAPQYEKWISEAAPERRDAFRQELRCPPERILGVLEHLQTKWGGVEAYLEASGMTPANIDRLSAKLE
jgi:protein-tyrosine phosphatase